MLVGLNHSKASLIDSVLGSVVFLLFHYGEDILVVARHPLDH